MHGTIKYDYTRVSDRQWDTLLRVLFSAIQIIEPPESLLIKNQLEDLIEDFAVRRAQGRQKSDILRGCHILLMVKPCLDGKI